MQLVQAGPASIERVLQINLWAGRHPWPESALRRALQASEVLLANVDGAKVGFLVSQPVLDETTLMHLAVAREYQRQGWGRQMMQGWLAQQRSSGQQRLLLEVRRSNQAAISLYRSLGFDTLGQRRGYYVTTDGVEDALVMALDLSPDESAYR
ncbi:MAG: ribosomal protein S18-alanine N-acetyltransferase [Saccharospirillum sp.]|uniref:ribosomal protein S18-alanine N-acetyltransferase n=1 Tax=Saccharospirillum sp. TaxID=2033801 RepID=UPI003299FE13